MKEKYKKKKSFYQKHKNWFSTKSMLTLFIALLMVFSILGMALMYDTGSSNENSNVNINSKNLPPTYLKEYNLWLAIVNGEKFIFTNNISNNYMKYNFTNLNLDPLLNKPNVYIYFDKSFDPSSEYLVLNFLKAEEKNVYLLNDSICQNGTVLFLVNMTKKLEGDCLKITYYNMTSKQMYDKTNSLLFYILKNKK